MNYKDLKELAVHIKKTMKCSQCKRRYTDKDLIMLAVLPAEGVFQLNCIQCNQSVIVNAGLSSSKTPKTVITQKDIQDMHVFLEEFNGDFKQLFKPSNK